MSEKKLMSWFEKRREESIVHKTVEHMHIVTLCVQEFGRGMDAFAAGKKEEALHSFERSMTYEHEADGIEMFIHGELSKGELEPKDRYDLMRMVRQVDYIADKIKSVDRTMRIFVVSGITVDAVLMAKIIELTRTTVKATEMLKAAIDDMGANNPHANVDLGMVNQLERVADDQYYEARALLFGRPNPDARAVVLVNDLIEGIERAADYCKSAAEMVELLLVAGR